MPNELKTMPGIVRDIKNYRVILTARKAASGVRGIRRKHGEYSTWYNIQSSSPEKAIACAIRYCTVLQGKITGVAFEATPEELGAQS